MSLRPTAKQEFETMRRRAEAGDRMHELLTKAWKEREAGLLSENAELKQKLDELAVSADPVVRGLREMQAQAFGVLERLVVRVQAENVELRTQLEEAQAETAAELERRCESNLYWQKRADAMGREYGELKRRLVVIERMDTPWPLVDVLRSLCNATEILLHERGYDAHGWETIQHAYEAGLKILAALAVEKTNG